jgi:hypothetical protein
MTGRRIVLIALLLGAGLLLARLSAESVRRNTMQLLVANGFSTRFSTPTSAELLRRALALGCDSPETAVCLAEVAGLSDMAVIETAGLRFLDDAMPVLIVSDSATFPITDFVASGLPVSLQGVDSSAVLYGPGYYEARLYLAAEGEACWQVGVTAQHDDPPPVDLEIWLDKDRMGTLSYDRGDQSWEELTIALRARPNLHWLRVWFVNDTMDETLGIDRNAYIQQVTITRVEDGVCE